MLPFNKESFFISIHGVNLYQLHHRNMPTVNIYLYKQLIIRCVAMRRQNKTRRIDASKYWRIASIHRLTDASLTTLVSTQLVRVAPATIRLLTRRPTLTHISTPGLCHSCPGHAHTSQQDDDDWNNHIYEFHFNFSFSLIRVFLEMRNLTFLK